MGEYFIDSIRLLGHIDDIGKQLDVSRLEPIRNWLIYGDMWGYVENEDSVIK